MPGAPTMEAVFAALERLRQSEDALDRAHDAEYRVLDSWLRSHGSAAERSDDVIQQSLLSVGRAVGRMEATSPKAALRWLGVVRRSRGRDALRATLHDPVAKGLVGTDQAPSVEGLAAPLSRPASREPLLALFAALEQEVDRLSEAGRVRVTLRHLRRVQARLTLHRVVLGADAQELMDLSGQQPPPTKEQIYKWVERGRAVVLAALEAWVATEPEQRDVAETLAELVRERRVDAGVARKAARERP